MLVKYSNKKRIRIEGNELVYNYTYKENKKIKNKNEKKSINSEKKSLLSVIESEED